MNSESEEKFEDDISDEELEDIANDWSDEDILQAIADENLLDLYADDDEEDEEDEEELTEVLSRTARLRSKTRMIRTKARRERGAKISRKRKAPNRVLLRRSKRLAIKALKRRLARRPLNTLSIADKERLERRIQRMKPVIARLARKFMPRVRQLDIQRTS